MGEGEVEVWAGSVGMSGTGAGVCVDRCEGGRVVMVSLWEERGCQRHVEHLGMEQKTSFSALPTLEHS